MELSILQQILRQRQRLIERGEHPDRIYIGPDRFAALMEYCQALDLDENCEDQIFGLRLLPALPGTLLVAAAEPDENT